MAFTPAESLWMTIGGIDMHVHDMSDNHEHTAGEIIRVSYPGTGKVALVVHELDYQPGEYDELAWPRIETKYLYGACTEHEVFVLEDDLSVSHRNVRGVTSLEYENGISKMARRSRLMLDMIEANAEGTRWQVSGNAANLWE